jgi:hypothetical protein
MGACQRSFLDQFSRMQRGNSNAQSRKMLIMMYNSLKLMSIYITKSNSCKMRERERERENIITFSPVHDDIYMYYVEIFFLMKKAL